MSSDQPPKVRDETRCVQTTIALDQLLWKETHLPDASLGRPPLKSPKPCAKPPKVPLVDACPALPDSIRSSVTAAGVPVARIWNRHLVKHVGIVLCPERGPHPPYLASGTHVPLVSYADLMRHLDQHTVLGERRTFDSLLTVLTAFPRQASRALDKLVLSWPIRPSEPGAMTNPSEAFRSATMSELGALFSASTLLFVTSNTYRGAASVFVCKHLNAEGQAPLGGFSVAMAIVAASIHEAHCRAAVGETGDGILFQFTLDNGVVRLQHGHLDSIVKSVNKSPS